MGRNAIKVLKTKWVMIDKENLSQRGGLVIWLKKGFIVFCLLLFEMISTKCTEQSQKSTHGPREVDWPSTASHIKESNLRSEVKVVDGVPVLYVNDKLTSQILAAPYRPEESHFRDFLEAGLKIFNIYLRFDWKGPKEYDFTKVDQKLGFYLEIEPEALFIPRVLLTPGDWWCEKFADEITMRDDGSAAGMFGRPCHPSFASKIYRELSYKAMAAFINHVEDKWGSHILGYQAGNGFGGEWLTFNSFWEIKPSAEPPNKFGVEDYSPPAKEAFKQWLKTKYQNNVGRLRLAWKDPVVTFETATPPNEVERYSATHGIFF